MLMHPREADGNSALMPYVTAKAQQDDVAVLLQFRREMFQAWIRAVVDHDDAQHFVAALECFL